MNRRNGKTWKVELPYVRSHCSRRWALFTFFVSILLLWDSASAEHVLRFSGVSQNQGRILQNQMPQVFQRPVTLSEVDDVVRLLMKSGLYSNIEVVAREVAGETELLLIANPLRKIKAIEVRGNRALSSSEILQLLQIDEGKVFERKELIESVRNLQTEYRKLGFRTMNAEVDFQTPSEGEVALIVKVDEGPPTVVDRVQVECPNPEVVSQTERLLRHLKGRPLSEQDLQNAVKDVVSDLRNKRYLIARVLDPQAAFDESQSRVRISLAIEQPFKFEFKLSGNLSFSDTALISEMNLDKLIGTVTTPAPELAERLRRFYQTNGFAHVEINVVEKTKEEKFLKEIYFTINEGPRVRIKRIDIAGNISREGSYYAQFITSSKFDILGEGYYNRKDIEAGIKALEEELQNQGYLRAKVKPPQVSFSNPNDRRSNQTASARPIDSRGSQATLFLNIDEGPLTVIRQIKFDGVQSFSNSELQNQLSIRASESLRIKELNTAIDELKAFYQSRGFIEMRILNEKEGLVTYNEASTQATVEFQIQEGPRVRINSIIIEGTSLTKDHVISREITMKPGDLYTTQLREDSIYNLQKLGLFSRVDIRTLEQGTSIADRTVIIEVEEGAPGTFESGVGVVFDRDWLFRGYAGVAYRNILGTGRAISFRVDPTYSTDPKVSYLEHKIAASYLEPYILRDRNKGRLNLVRDVKFIGVDSEGKTIILAKNEVGVQVERDLTKRLKLIFTAYNLSSQNEFDRSNPDNVKRTQNIAKTGPQLEYDTRDNVFYPTSGVYAQIGVEYSDPNLGSSEDASQSIKFTKLNASFSYPHRIFGSSKWIFATSLRTGYLANLSLLPQGGVPDQEAFFLGGRSTLRGFQPTSDAVDLERVPNIVQLGKANLRDFYVTSDSYYYLIKAEIRFPIYGDVQGALFYDGGAVMLSQLRIDSPYRDSAGIAIRYKFAGGIVAGLEYGKKLERKNWHPNGYERPEAWHLSIGTF